MSDQPDSTTPDNTTIERELESVRAVVAKARDQLRAGLPVDLAGLDRMVKTVCDAILALPKPSGRPFLPALESLLEAFNALSAETTPAAETAATRRRATTAYGRPPGASQE